MDNIIYTPGIDVINELAAEAGCNCRVARQWIKETANKVKETVTETVEEVKETIVSAFETIKDIYSSTTEQEIEYCTNDLELYTKENLETFTAAFNLATECGLVSTELLKYLKEDSKLHCGLVKELLETGTFDPYHPVHGLDNKELWNKVSSTLPDAEYFEQNFMSEEEAGVVSFPNEEVDPNDDYFSQYEEYETGDQVEEPPISIQDVFGDRTRVLTSRGVFTSKSFKFLLRHLNRLPSDELRRIVIHDYYDCNYFTEDQAEEIIAKFNG